MTSRPVAFGPAPAGGPARDAAATRLGGQPHWLEEPQWPYSEAADVPMDFIGQFRVEPPGEPPRLAYVFLSHHPESSGSFNPESGENAVVVQPGRTPDFFAVDADPEGPTVSSEPLYPRELPAQVPQGVGHQLGGPGVEHDGVYSDGPPEPGWQLVVQLDSGLLPFFVNFGDCGVGYAWLSPDGLEGRFTWEG